MPICDLQGLDLSAIPGYLGIKNSAVSNLLFEYDVLPYKI